MIGKLGKVYLIIKLTNYLLVLLPLYTQFNIDKVFLAIYMHIIIQCDTDALCEALFIYIDDLAGPDWVVDLISYCVFLEFCFISFVGMHYYYYPVLHLQFYFSIPNEYENILLILVFAYRFNYLNI